jgi:hypothetical protein
VLAIAALTAGFVYAYQHSEKFRNVVNTVWAALKTGFSWAKSNWKLLLGILTGPFGLAAYVIQGHFGSIVDFIKARINDVIDVINLAIKAFNFLPGPNLGEVGHIGGSGALAGSYGTGTTGARAAGGPVRAGASYRVNERGVEILEMGSRGGYVHDAQSAAAMMAGGGTDPALVAAIMALAGRPIVLMANGREIARVNAETLATEAAFS